MPVTSPNAPLSTILITGATGSLGMAMTACLLALPDGPRVRAFSRDEKKQEDAAQRYPPGPRLTYILGDVRDHNALYTAMDGCDGVIHAAALKRVPQSVTNAEEFFKTNTLGAANVIQAAREAGVRHTLLISSDKAVSALSSNEYGKGKAIAEGLFVAANVKGESRGCLYSVVRGGNIWNSRGSVVEKWRAAVENDERLYVTGQENTRFHLTMTDWTAFVWRVLNEMHGGEIFVPKCRSWRILDLAQAFGPRDIVVGPPRSGDKKHEIMVDGSGRVKDIGWAYVVEPPPELRAVWNYREWYGSPMPDDFEYSSLTADKMTIDELRTLIRETA